ncbi:MAG: MerR family transcriptional regulator [Alphaproteobacteria bacterium]|nr:MerR family transcriptional regulator [Alphaproteobacteria bacterium]
MAYSIGQVAKITGLTTHTLRYYDKFGLLPSVGKNSAGLRRFTDDDLRWLNILECLKSTGLQLKDIKHYIDLSKQGDASLQERYQILLKQKKRVEEEMLKLKSNMEKLDFKIKYYETALKYGEKQVYNHNSYLRDAKDKLFKKWQ